MLWVSTIVRWYEYGGDVGGMVHACVFSNLFSGSLVNFVSEHARSCEKHRSVAQELSRSWARFSVADKSNQGRCCRRPGTVSDKSLLTEKSWRQVCYFFAFLLGVLFGADESEELSSLRPRLMGAVQKKGLNLRAYGVCIV